MTSRARLPNRRAASTFNFEVGGLRYTATVGRFHDGRIGELFLQNHKSDSSADTNARDAAIAASLLLQHGCPVDTLRRALTRNADGLASGPLAHLLDLLDEQTNQKLGAA